MNQEHNAAGAHLLPDTRLESTSTDQLWMENYKKLEAFQKANGHCMIFLSSGDKSLDTWVWNQRFLQQTDRLRQDRKALLDALGFIWDNHQTTTTRQDAAAAAVAPRPPRPPPPSTPPPPPSSMSWMGRYNQLVEFKQKNGHLRVPVVEDKDLNVWLNRQRSQFKLGKLGKEEGELLDKINFAWKVYRKSSKQAPSSVPAPVQNQLAGVLKTTTSLKPASVSSESTKISAVKTSADVKMSSVSSNTQTAAIDKAQNARRKSTPSEAGTPFKGETTKLNQKFAIKTTKPDQKFAIGTRIEKIFVVDGVSNAFGGIVAAFDLTEDVDGTLKWGYLIHYDDGDKEHMREADVAKNLVVVKSKRRAAKSQTVPKSSKRLKQVNSCVQDSPAVALEEKNRESVHGLAKSEVLGKPESAARAKSVGLNRGFISVKERQVRRYAVPKSLQRQRELDSCVQDTPAVALQEKSTESVHGLAKSEVLGKPESAARAKNVNSGSTSTENTRLHTKRRAVSETNTTPRKGEHARVSRTRDDAGPSRPFKDIKCSPGIPKRASHRKATRAKETPTKQLPSYYLGSGSSLSDDSSLYLPASKPRARARTAAKKKKEGAPSRRPLSYYVDTESSWTDEEPLHLSAQKPKATAPKDEKKENEAKQIQAPEIIDLMDVDDDDDDD